jgi:hypothetical protein
MSELQEAQFQEAQFQEELTDLFEKANDLQSDALKDSKHALEEMVELGQQARAKGAVDLEEARSFDERRRSLLGKSVLGGGALAAGGLGAALLGVLSQASRAFAGTPTDAQILQTNASIEVIAVSTYKTALTLPYIGGSSANPVIKAFCTTTMGQHEEHLKAFNAALSALGAKTQDKPDPVLVPIVKKAVKKITSSSPAKGAARVVDLALELEDGAAETYIVALAALKDDNAKKLTASIMGVEAQHAAVLRAVKALLADPSLIALPPNVPALPSAAGSVGFPDAFFHTDHALSLTSGALS